MVLTRLMIEILDTDAIDPSVGLPRIIEAQFNPAEYTRAKAAQIGEIAIPGIDSPILQFIRGQNEKLTLELFFDTTASGMNIGAVDVQTLTRSIYQLVKIQPKTHAPPRILVSWGRGLAFKAIVESVQQKFTLFSPEGVPLRAMVSVTFREYKTLEEQLSELNLQSPDVTRQRVVRRGDTLARIAAEEYDDPREWRRIATANQLDNPRNLAPGTVLEVPPLERSAAGLRRR